MFRRAASDHSKLPSTDFLLPIFLLYPFRNRSTYHICSRCLTVQSRSEIRVFIVLWTCRYVAVATINVIVHWPIEGRSIGNNVVEIISPVYKHRHTSSQCVHDTISSKNIILYTTVSKVCGGGGGRYACVYKHTADNNVTDTLRIYRRVYGPEPKTLRFFAPRARHVSSLNHYTAILR